MSTKKLGKSKKVTEALREDDIKSNVITADVKLKASPAIVPTSSVNQDRSFFSADELILEEDNLKIYGKNPAYEYHWCLTKAMANGRSKNWVSVKRDDPAHADLRVAVDHSPEQNYIQYLDVILCAMPKGRADQLRKIGAEKVKRKTEGISQKFGDDVAKISRALGNRSESLSVMKTIDKNT